MNNSTTLKEAIKSVLECQRKNGHPDSYIIDLQRTYNSTSLTMQGNSGQSILPMNL